MRKFLTLCLILCCLFSMFACSKDEVIEQYNDALQAVGDNNLTSDRKLQGDREFGVDSYVGTYQAEYDDFTGKEIVFGGTAIERESGNQVNISCDLNIENGTVRLLFQSGDNTPQILCETSDPYSETIELSPASNYIIVQAEKFIGSIKLTVE